MRAMHHLSSCFATSTQDGSATSAEERMHLRDQVHRGSFRQGRLALPRM